MSRSSQTWSWAASTIRSTRAPIDVFAVDTDRVQLTWRGAASGKVTIVVDDQEVVIDAADGPGAITLGGLEPGRAYTAEAKWPGGRTTRLPFRTLEAMAGPVRSRVATVSDLHLGQHSFGVRYNIADRMVDGEWTGARCSRQALAEAVAWGADLIVVKGDVTNSGRRYEWAQAAAMVDDVEVPVVFLPGNHDNGDRRNIESWQAAERYGLHVVRSVDWIDLPAIRVVLATTALPGRSRGRLEHRREDVVAAAAGGPAALVALHHQLELRLDPPLWPPGIPRAEAHRFLDDLAAAQPASLVTSGHTHRHRRYRHGPVTVTQVGSTKDYPGVWAGYSVHDAGIRQVVTRVSDPLCLAWTDRTRAAAGGLWGAMSLGTIDSRRFSRPWPADDDFQPIE